MTTYRANPTGGTSRVRSLVGPEVVAAILVAIGVVVGVIAVNNAPGIAFGPFLPSPSVVGALASATPVVSPSPTPAVAPAASPTSAVGGVVATPKPSPSPTPLGWASQANAALAAGARVVEARGTLQTHLALDPVPADELSRDLRSLNANLAVALSTIRSLERAGAPAAITAPLRAAIDAASATSLETLKASLGNVLAYTSGSTAVVEALAGIEGGLHDLALAAGVRDPYPSASASPTP